MAASLITTGTVSAKDWDNVLAEVPLFAGLSSRHLRAIAKLAKIQRVAPYSEIVRAGDTANTFYLILDGSAVVRPPGKRAVNLGIGDFFGELALLADAPRSATVAAKDEEVLLARIGRKQFLKLVEDEPKVALTMLRTLADRLRAGPVSHTH